MLEIVPLADIARSAIEDLLDSAFEPWRKSRTSYSIRADQPWLPALSYAALDEAGQFCGQLQCTRVGLHAENGQTHPVTFVGPLAVLPSHQGRGVGQALMSTLMEAHASGKPDTDAFAVIGDPDYFARLYGFSADLTRDWVVPGPVERPRLLARVSRVGGLPLAGQLGPLGQPDMPFALTRATA